MFQSYNHSPNFLFFFSLGWMVALLVLKPMYSFGDSLDTSETIPSPSYTVVFYFQKTEKLKCTMSISDSFQFWKKKQNYRWRTSDSMCSCCQLVSFHVSLNWICFCQGVSRCFLQIVAFCLSGPRTEIFIPSRFLTELFHNVKWAFLNICTTFSLISALTWMK